MNNKETLKAFVATLVGVVLLSNSVVGQQPFDTLPGNDNADGQDEPIIVRPNQDRTPARSFQTPDDREEIPDQVILLNTRFAGWQEAGVGTNRARLSNELRANWIKVDPNGLIEGKVTGLQGVEVENMSIYLMNMGRLVKEAQVDKDGNFSFNNVRQGAYAIIGWGTKAFFAFGLDILANNQNVGTSMPTTLNITAYQNATSINTDWIRFFSPRVDFRVYGRYPVGEGQNDPAALYGFEGLDRYQPKAAPATSISSHVVNRTADGRLLGRIHQLNSISGRPVDVRTTKVMLFQGDDVYAATNTDNFGVFEFKNVPNGEFGLVAAGADGVGMIGIKVGEFSVMNDEGEVTRPDGDLIDICLIPSETVGWLNNYANEVAYLRSLLAPRPPQSRDNYCNECGGAGCQNCYGTGLCKSRAQAYREWVAHCRNQHEKTKFGSGFILGGIAADLREGVQAQDRRYERAFYEYGTSYGGTFQGN